MTTQDRLDRILRHDAAHAIDDGGFSSRVMRALPAPRALPSAWFKPALVLGSAALGSALAVVLGPQDASFIQGFIDIAHMRGATPATLTALCTSFALLVCAVVLAAESD